MEPLNLAIVGTGEAARNTGLALRETSAFRLHRVFGRDAGRTRAFVAEFGGMAVADLRSLLEDPTMDAVLVATPDGAHAEIAVAAAQSGKHLLVPKPLATSVADARAIADACRTNGVRLAVGYHHRHHPGLRALRAWIREHWGERPSARVDATWTYAASHGRVALGASGWRAQGGSGRWWAMAAIGTHAVDIGWMLLGQPDLHVRSATLDLHPALRRETGAAVELGNESASLFVRVSYAAEADERRIVLTRGNERVVCEGVFGATGTGRIILPDGSALPYQPRNPYAAELEAFATAIRSGTEPEAHGGVGLQNVVWLEEIESLARDSR